MSDYTEATLTLAGALTSPEDAQRLAREMHLADGHFQALPLAPGPIPQEYDFDDVYQGALPDALGAILTTLGLSYIWSSGSGDEFGRSRTVHHAGQTLHQDLSEENLPYLNLGDFDNAEKRAAISAFVALEAQVRALPFVYAPTAHAVLAHHAAVG